MTRLPASQAREQLSEILNRVSVRGERVILHRHGKDVAAVVSMEDLRRLATLADSAAGVSSAAFPVRLTVAAVKRAVVPLLRRYGVQRAAVFGSVARGDAQSGSDVDMLVEFERDRSLLDLIGLELDLEERLQRKVDVVTYASLTPRLAERALAEQIVIL